MPQWLVKEKTMSEHVKAEISDASGGKGILQVELAFSLDELLEDCDEALVLQWLRNYATVDHCPEEIFGDEYMDQWGKDWAEDKEWTPPKGGNDG